MAARLRPVLAVAAVSAATTAAAAAAAVLVASARLVGPPDPGWSVPASVGPSPLRRTVRLSGPDVDRPGRWGVGYPGGYVQVDRVVLRHGDGSVSRRVVHLFGAEPDGTVDGRLDRVAFPTDPQLLATVFDGLEVVPVAGPDGLLPALTFASAGDRPLLVGVHGRGVAPSEVLRLLPAARRAGMGLWAVSYRNDPLAGPDRDGRSYLGEREADDVAAALAAAATAGWSRVVLAGVSLGGAVVVNLLVRFGRVDGDGRVWLTLPAAAGTDGHPAAEATAEVEVVGVVLEAPAVDWRAVVGHLAVGMRLPRLLAGPTVRLARLRARLDPVTLRPLVQLDRMALPSLPVLVVHGDADPVVPVEVSDRLVGSLPQAVFLRLPGVGHARAFNEAPDRFIAATAKFFDSLA